MSFILFHILGSGNPSPVPFEVIKFLYFVEMMDILGHIANATANRVKKHHASTAE
jgi:hypothetical protein